MRSKPVLGDSVDRVLDEWEHELPELSVAPVGIVTRVGRVRARLEEELARLFTAYDLTNADFVVISSLRRAGQPYELSQSTLVQRLGLTSGTVSVRLARLAVKEVVLRRPHPEDSRGALIRLTERGLALFDEVAPAHLANEERLLSALTPQQQEQLADLLRVVLVSFEHERASSPLGLVLRPAHVARRMRVAVGLPDEPGLLVAEVRPESAAAAAGARPGDLLVELDGRPLRSCTDLAERVAAGGWPLRLTAHRGVDPVRLDVPLDSLRPPTG